MGEEEFAKYCEEMKVQRLLLLLLLLTSSISILNTKYLITFLLIVSQRNVY